MPDRSGGARRVLTKITSLSARARVRLALAGGVVAAVAMFAACTACGRRAPGGGDTTSARASDDAGASTLPPPEDAAALRSPLLWESAKSGEAYDLATLAAHEGAMGLVEAAADPALRATALRAMAYARGWAQMPLLARAATGGDDEEALLALASAFELATRPRTSEDPEDADELRVGCEGLSRLARDASRPRSRRVAAVRALRMLPCPPMQDGGALPTDLDAL